MKHSCWRGRAQSTATSGLSTYARTPLSCPINSSKHRPLNHTHVSTGIIHTVEVKLPLPSTAPAVLIRFNRPAPATIRAPQSPPQLDESRRLTTYTVATERGGRKYAVQLSEGAHPLITMGDTAGGVIIRTDTDISKMYPLIAMGETAWGIIYRCRCSSQAIIMGETAGGNTTDTASSKA